MTIRTTDPKEAKKKVEIDHPGMMGDGTEEQNLGESGDPAARIKKEDVDGAFADLRRQSSSETHKKDNDKP
jgi:hypothetical protein